MTDDYRVLRSEPVYRGRVIALRRDEVRMSDGSTAVREVVEHPGAVGIVAVDDEQRVVLVNQYRHPLRARLDELPAGLLDVEGEAPLAAAQRELAEEARLAADEWNVLVDLNPSPGMSDEGIRLYLARGLHDLVDEEFSPEHEEITLTVHRVPLAEAIERIYAGELTNASAVAGVLAAARCAESGWGQLRPADAPWPSRARRGAR